MPPKENRLSIPIRAGEMDYSLLEDFRDLPKSIEK
jgi:hypothetical protein